MAGHGSTSKKKTSQITIRTQFWPIILWCEYRSKICEISECFYQIFTSKQCSITVHTRFILSILCFGICNLGNLNLLGRSVNFASALSILVPTMIVCGPILLFFSALTSWGDPFLADVYQFLVDFCWKCQTAKNGRFDHTFPYWSQSPTALRHGWTLLSCHYNVRSSNVSSNMLMG